MANDIRVAVGDALKIQVILEDEDGEEVSVGDDDVLTLTIAPEVGGDAELEKTVTGSAVFELTSDETNALGLGMHAYDITLETDDGITTAVAPDAFMIMPRVVEVAE